ncbi:collagen alpha chain-like [Hetaerina americana]|uniref:collagen alpha chain-like n=1 Tax=Hetaerina americana TaxID=62018 RepID=UPI003A7F2F90
MVTSEAILEGGKGRVGPPAGNTRAGGHGETGERGPPTSDGPSGKLSADELSSPEDAARAKRASGSVSTGPAAPLDGHHTGTPPSDDDARGGSWGVKGGTTQRGTRHTPRKAMA